MPNKNVDNIIKIEVNIDGNLDDKKNFKKSLHDMIVNHPKYSNGITVVCIGTDRCTGDCLGPLMGTFLSKNKKAKNVKILGTLNNPVHAKNLHETLESINDDSLIIAIDACLGKEGRVGLIVACNKPLNPGAGMGKVLPSVGDISIVGVVNTSGLSDFITLQNTRLGLIYNMAEFINRCMYKTLSLAPNKKVTNKNQLMA